MFGKTPDFNCSKDEYLLEVQRRKVSSKLCWSTQEFYYYKFNMVNYTVFWKLFI